MNIKFLIVPIAVLWMLFVFAANDIVIDGIENQQFWMPVAGTANIITIICLLCFSAYMFFSAQKK